MRAGIVRAGVPSPVGKGVKLFDVAEIETGLLGDPVAQPDVERAVVTRCEWAERQGRARRTHVVGTPGVVLAAYGQDFGPVIPDGYDRGTEPISTAAASGRM